MKIYLKYPFSVLAIIFAVYLLYLNVKLYYKPDIEDGCKYLYNKEVVKQLNFIQEEIGEHSLGEKMQQIYPEGYFFSQVLYGLTISETTPLFFRNKNFSIYAPDEIDKVLDALYSEKGTRIFPVDLQPKYGIFYAGWTNYLLAKKLYTTQYFTIDSSDLKTFETKCDEIYQAFQQKEMPYLESYKGGSWPADNIVAVASLALHDKILPPKYENFIRLWLTKVKRYLDKDGLIPHKVDFKSGKTIEQAKGSSQSLMLCFLYDIDTDFARGQFNIYKKLFVDYRFGLPGIREHKKGISDGADIDSGPVILDIGGSASVVGLKTMAIYKEIELLAGLRNSIEAFGMAMPVEGKNGNNTKKYLFGQLPIADCFIAWSSTKAWSHKESEIGNWRWKFQLITLGILLFIAGFNYWMYKK